MKKTHLSKRLLSILLSALMIVTSVPLTFAATPAVEALADVPSNHIVGAYLTRNAKDGVSTTAGTVTWDNNNGAYFNGSSRLKIDGTPFNSVTNATGFTITFETKATAAAAVDNSFVIKFMTDDYYGDSNNMDARDYFAFRGLYSANSDYRNNAIQYRANWGGTAGVWTWDFYNADYFVTSSPSDATGTTYAAQGSANEIVNPTTNTTYRYTISMDSDGYMYYYRDGLLFGKLRNDYYTQGVGDGVKASYLKTVFAKFKDYVIGANYTGYIKNLYLFDSCLTDSQAQSEISGCTGGTISQLASAISAYETKMDGTVFTNMGAAYQAYMMAVRAYDAYYYGNDTTINLSLYIDPLVRATANMTAWTATTTFTSATPYFSTDGNSNASYYITQGNGTWYNNLLYTEDSSHQVCAPTDWGSGKYTGVKIRHSENTVLFFDGLSDSLMPVVALVYNTGNGASGTRVVYTVYPNNGTDAKNVTDNDNTEIQVKEAWHGKDENQDCFMYCIAQTERVGCLAANPGKNWSSSVKDKNKKYYYASSLKVLPNGIDFDGKAYKNLQNLHWQFYGGSDASSNGAQNRNDLYGADTSSSNIYVFNYRDIKTEINSATHTGYLNNVENYKAGGLLDVMNGYNILACNNISTTSHDWTGTVTLDTFEYGFGKIKTTPTADSSYAANYATYRTFADTSRTSTVANVDKRYTGTPIEAYNGGVNSCFTSATFTPYVTAYEAAAAEMAKVLCGGYTSAGNTAINTLKGNLQTAFDNLEKSITYLPSVSAGGDYLNRTDNITFNLHASDANTSRIHYTVDYNNDTDVTETTVADGATLQLFNNTSTTATVTYWSVNADGALSATQTATYGYLSAPTVSVSDNAELDDYSKVRIYQSNSSGYQLQYSIDYWNQSTGTWANSWSAYANPDGLNDFQPFGEGVNTTHSKVRIRAIQTNGTVSSDATTPVVVLKSPNIPTVTLDGTYLDKTHGFTVANNNDGYDGTVALEYMYDGDADWTPYNGKVLPFSGKADGDGADTKTVKIHAVRNGIYSGLETETVKYLSRPDIKFGGVAITSGTELLANDTITINKTSNSDSGTLKYAFSIDGGNTWSNEKTYSDAFAPFNETVYFGLSEVSLSTKVNVMMKAWEECDGSASVAYESGAILLKQATPLGIYHISSGSVRSTDSFDGTGNFFINTAGYEGCSIFYQADIDGATGVSYNPYNINAGIDATAYASAKVVTFRFYVIENNSKTVFATGTFKHSANYSDVAFRESFDGASVSGTTLTLSGSNGTATASAADSFSIQDGAGWVYNGEVSPDYRNNVLKINANDNKNYNITLANNPLTDSATKYIAKKDGITISLWRYVPDTGDGKQNTVEYWEPTVSFQQPQGANGERYYFLTTEVGYVTRSDSAIDGNNDYNKYVDIKPDVQDPTQHATGNRRNRWVNIVVTVDPTSGVTVYTNGEPHPTTVTTGTGGSHGNYTGNNAALAQDILDFITNSNTTMAFGAGQGYWQLTKDLYLDDIRIYTGVKTQVDINNMYIYDADVESDISSTSHDPTNVTVYTLARAVATDSNGTKPAGAKVGQEFIDYYGLDATNDADVAAIDEYSFGTGMTIYHLNKTTGKWDVVGDDQGNCGYQNTKLFGSEYTTGIATALAAATGDGASTGAGYLVWAPHVMYNLTTDKWVYYGSTSSWGVQKSAIFMCQNDTNDDITGPYTYKEITYKSTSHPNAIDPCVYYQYSLVGGVYKPVKSALNMVFGSWGGDNAIATKTLNANGTTTSNNSHNGIIATGVNESGSADGSSCEGAYVIFNNGYYYLYVSVGQNTGSYTERVFRSTDYNDGFVDITGTEASSTATEMKGNQIIAPFDLSNYDYIFKSTGHNSVYKTVNKKGEIVTLHSTHARPNTSAGHDWLGLPDNALATCQSEVDGNLNLINQVAYNSLGWPVLMPFQYNGTDTVKATITAKDLEGVYAANDLGTVVPNAATYGVQQYTYTIVADDADPNIAYEYGTDSDGEVFTDYIVLSTGADGTRYANYYASESDYDPENPNDNIAYCGVVGTHVSGTETIIGITMVRPDDKEHTWTYRMSKIPQAEDVNSLGDSVSMDGVIYTHKVNDLFSKYGYEISDDFQYGTSNQHQGERCTTITTTYPAKIDVNNSSAVYCVSDEAIAKLGDYSGGAFTVVALNDNKWYTDGGTKYTDAEAAAAISAGTVTASDLHRLYGIKGYVSNYYFNASTGEFAEKGVELIVSYVDVTTGSNYSEFEFCYVAPNPAMAHTIQGIRNQYHGSAMGITTDDHRAGLILFDRFLGSYGASTEIGTTKVWNDGASVTSEAHSTGTYNYLGSFGSSESTSFDYSSPDKTAGAFSVFGSKVGVNSGSYGLVEHSNNGARSFTVSSAVVDTDYYIDYSNTDNYDINNDYGTITTSGGVPTGYKFDFRTSNIKWQYVSDRRWNATSYMLLTGDLKDKVTTDSTYDSTKDTYVSQNCTNNEGRYTYGNYTSEEKTALGYTDDSFLISGIGNQSSNAKSQNVDGFGSEKGFANKYTVGLINGEVGNGRKVMSGYYSDPTTYDATYPNNDYYTAGFTRALPLIDSGMSDTNQWNMHISFSGTQSVSKNADPGDVENRAEKYANFIIEQGIGVFSYSTGHYVNMEETYAYYNIGVHTCDKGAARAFAENYLRKKLAVNADGTVKVDETTGAPIYLTAGGVETTNVNEAAIINAQEYSLDSYQAYIDAVAELNYFVKNPTNTTFKDYANSGSSASTEYTTAYTSTGNPIYITTTDAVTGQKNIFSEADTSVRTDSVQAKLIQDVITAYENLFELAEYQEAENIHRSIQFFNDDAATAGDLIPAAEMASVDAANVKVIKLTKIVDETPTVVEFDKANYTADSWSDFVSFINDIKTVFNYSTSDSDTSNPSWRRTVFSEEEYEQIEEFLTDASSSLLPAVNTNVLSGTRTTKLGVVSSGISVADVQAYTYASWKALKNECATAATIISTPTTNYNGGANLAATDVVDGEDIVNHANEEADFTYTKGQYEVTGITKYTFGGVNFYERNFTASDENLTDVQENVNAENTKLSAMALALVDYDANYETFDAAYTVVNTVNTDKYTAAGLAKLAEALSEHDDVYKPLTAEEAAEYNTAVGSDVYTAGDTVKNTDRTTDTTDSHTTTLLNTANELELPANIDTYVKSFTGTVTVKNAANGTVSGPTTLTNAARDNITKFYYGDTYNVAIPEEAQGKCEISIQYYDNGVAAGAQKVNYNGASFTKNAIHDMDVTIKYTDKGASEGYYKVLVKDIYDTVYETYYASTAQLNSLLASDWTGSSSFTLGEDTVTAPAVPFFTFRNWSLMSRDDDGMVVIIKAFYNVQERVTLNVYGATSIDGATQTGTNTYSTLLDEYVSITSTGAYGWATVATDGKYQIAAYGDTINLYAVTTETFCPITRSGAEGSYTYSVLNNGNTVALSASNVASVFTVESDALTPNQIVQQKLDNKLPFVSLIYVDTKENANNKFSYGSAYCRVTTGSAGYSSIGVLGTSKEANCTTANMVQGTVNVYKTSTVLPTGQYTYTITSSGSGFARICFRGYITYDLTYAAASGSAKLNLVEYSSNIILENSTSLG